MAGRNDLRLAQSMKEAWRNGKFLFLVQIWSMVGTAAATLIFERALPDYQRLELRRIADKPDGRRVIVVNHSQTSIRERSNATSGASSLALAVRADGLLHRVHAPLTEATARPSTPAAMKGVNATATTLSLAPHRAALKRSLAQEPSAPEQRTAKRKQTKRNPIDVSRDCSCPCGPLAIVRSERCRG